MQGRKWLQVQHLIGVDRLGFKGKSDSGLNIITLRTYTALPIVSMSQTKLLKPFHWEAITYFPEESFQNFASSLGLILKVTLSASLPICYLSLIAKWYSLNLSTIFQCFLLLLRCFLTLLGLLISTLTGLLWIELFELIRWMIKASDDIPVCEHKMFR